MNEKPLFIACMTCGDLELASQAYFVSPSGKRLPPGMARCVSCHELTVRKESHVPLEGEQKVVPRR
jgi:hypothetical protein